MIPSITECNFRGSRVAVTGGLGLIGSFVAEELLRRGAHIVIIDDESKGSWQFIEHLRDQVAYRKGNLEEALFALNALEGCEHVFHLASRAYGVGYSSRHHVEMLRHNDLVTTNVLNAIEQHRPKRVLVVSSSCVYDDSSETPMSDGVALFGEPERANLGYGWAKRMLEQKAKLYQGECGVPFTIVRPFNVYGERYQWAGERSQAIPMLVKRVLDGENPLMIWGSGRQSRDYVHAEDCARIMIDLVQCGYSGDPVNIGSEHAVSLKDIAVLMAEVYGKPIELRFDLTRPEGRFMKISDGRRLRSILGEKLEFRIDLRTGLARMEGWYRERFRD